MTTVAPRPTATPHRRHPWPAIAVGVALLIAGLVIGLLLAFSSGGGTARPSGGPSPTGPVSTANQHPSNVDSCYGKLRGPC